jgi:hypothetical protein
MMNRLKIISRGHRDGNFEVGSEKKKKVPVLKDCSRQTAAARNTEGDLPGLERK